MRGYLGTALLLIAAPSARAEDVPAWVEPMKQVHAKFTGKPGTLALFGDSITVSQAFCPPPANSKNLPATIGKDLEVVKAHMLADCWTKWRGPGYGNDGGQTIRWADDNVAGWLKKHNPEAVVLMFGTNDLNQLDAKEYDKRTRSVIDRCLKNGSVVILTTIPPRAGLEKKSREFAEVERRIAAELKVPLIDYQAEILKRRPDDWNGAAAKFRDRVKDVYQVPTLISGDGVHPSNPSQFRDYSEDALSKNGYQLRTALTLNSYADVIRHVLAKKR